MKKIPLFVWITLSISLLIASGSIAYYYLVILPNKSALETEISNLQNQNNTLQNTITEIEGSDRKETDRVANIRRCQDEAYSNYSINWDNTCKAQGLNKDCNLPIALKQPLEESLKNDEQNCINIYTN